MPHDAYGNYYDQGFLRNVLEGLVILLALGVILSIPGWVSVGIWGWEWFFRGAAVFWLGAMSLTLIVVALAAIGDPDY